MRTKRATHPFYPSAIQENAIDHLIDRTRCLVEQRRRALETQFGWTHLQATVDFSTATRHLTVRGEVVLPHLIEQLRQELCDIVPSDWTVVMRLQPLAGGPWQTLGPGVTRLERFLPSRGQPVTLTTELLRRDGPVQCLARQAGASLVRSSDGTIGWTTRLLGPVTQRPRRPAVQCNLAGFERRLRSYLGVPYLLGGATRSGMDCSALVQRTLRDAVRAIVPRHSLDQLHATAPPGRALGEPGDRIYTWSKAEPSCHVGVVLRGERSPRRTVIHASTSRRRVLEEPLDRFLARADRVAHAELAQILDGPSCPVPA